MFQTRLTHTLEAVNHLSTAVASKVEPRILLHGLYAVNLADAYQLAAAQTLVLLALVLHLVQSLAQRAQVLFYQSVGNVCIVLHGEVDAAAQVLLHMAAEQLPSLILVACALQALEEVVVGQLLLLLAVSNIAAHQQEDGQGNHGTHGHESAVVHDGHHQGTHHEGHTGCEEPSADDTEHTRNAEHGTLAAPGTVGQRRTHGHHEGDVGGGEGKFQRSTQSDEQSGQHEVDRCTHEVESSTVGHDGLVLIEAAVDPRADALGDDADDGIGRIGGRAHHAACHG